MNRHLTFRLFAGLSALCIFASSTEAQSTELRWKKDFPTKVSWYVRTSPGILLVKAGKSLTALDSDDGRQLWALPDVESAGIDLRNVGGQFQRGKNILEVPEIGVLLMNRAKLPGDTDGRLIALNLLTGERLWDEPELDDLITVVPLPQTHEIVVVSLRLQKKILAGELIGSAAVGSIAIAYPFRTELQRIDPLTGKVRWNTEYPHTFTPSALSVTVIGRRLYLSNNNHILGSVDLQTGNRAWEEGSKFVGGAEIPFPVETANDRLIYGLRTVQAVDPATRQKAWETSDLGKITGISVQGDLVVAVGNKSAEAVDTKNGTERWRRKTYGHGTNVIWDKDSDTVVYVDGKGLHRVDRKTGIAVFDVPLQDINHPVYIRFAGPGAVMTISAEHVCGYDLKTGEKLFTTGRLTSFFPSYATWDHWPMPGSGEDFLPPNRTSYTAADLETTPEGGLLSGTPLKRVEAYAARSSEQPEAYETEGENGVHTIWWIDSTNNRKIDLNVSGKSHDVSRSMGLIFASDQNRVWGATIVEK